MNRRGLWPTANANSKPAVRNTTRHPTSGAPERLTTPRASPTVRHRRSPTAKESARLSSPSRGPTPASRIPRISGPSLPDDVSQLSSDDEERRRGVLRPSSELATQREQHPSPAGNGTAQRRDDAATRSHSDWAVTCLEGLYFDEYEQRVTHHDLPAILTALGYLPPALPGLEAVAHDPERAATLIMDAVESAADDAWLLMVKGVPSPYVDFPSFCQVLREMGLPNRALIAKRSAFPRQAQPPSLGVSRSTEGTTETAAAAKGPLLAHSVSQSRGASSSSRGGDAGGRARSMSRRGHSAAAQQPQPKQPQPQPQPKRAPSTPRGQEQKRGSKGSESRAQTSRETSKARTPRASASPQRFTTHTQSSQRRSSQQSDASGGVVKPKVLSEKAVAVSNRLHSAARLGKGCDEKLKAVAEELEARQKKELEECTFKPTITPYSGRSSKENSMSTSGTPQDSGTADKPPLSGDSRRIQRVTKAWAAHLDPSTDAPQHHQQGAPLGQEEADCTFRPAVNPSYVEAERPRPARGYFETVQRMRQYAADPHRYLKGLQAGLREGPAFEAASELRSLLHKPLTAVAISDTEELVISPTRVDPRRIAAAFCDEKHIPLNDPHRCEVERTVRYVIEQALVPHYRTQPTTSLYSSRHMQRQRGFGEREAVTPDSRQSLTATESSPHSSQRWR